MLPAIITTADIEASFSWSTSKTLEDAKTDDPSTNLLQQPRFRTAARPSSPTSSAIIHSLGDRSSITSNTAWSEYEGELGGKAHIEGEGLLAARGTAGDVQKLDSRTYDVPRRGSVLTS